MHVIIISKSVSSYLKKKMNNNDYLMDLANNASVKEQFSKDQFPEGLLVRRQC